MLTLLRLRQLAVYALMAVLFFCFFDVAAQEQADSAVMLQEVVVRPKKVKYSKKNNPAVDLMERVRAAAGNTDPRRKPFYSYRRYDKHLLGLDNFNPSAENGFIAKHMSALLDFIDTSDISGKPVLPISMRETSSRVMFRKSPKAAKEVVEGVQTQSLLHSFNEDGVNAFVNDVLREVDIYDNDVIIMQNRFVSPLSRIAANYYKFYLDTLNLGSERLLELSFAPHNPESMGFNGRMYIPLQDSAVFISRVSMQVPRAINLNYVKNLYIVQEFERDPDGTRRKVRDDMSVELEILPGTQGLFGRRVSIYDQHSAEEPQQPWLNFLDKEGSSFTLADADRKNDKFWQQARMAHVSDKEQGLDALLPRLREKRWFYFTEKILTILVNGYIGTGKDSKFDFGPVNTLISANTVEGARLRLGGMTTANLSRHLFARGYVAYGFKDHKFKYSAELEYSFNEKKYHSREFPIHSLKISHSYDLDQVGQHYLFTNADNLFLSLKRKENDKVAYRHITRFDYTLERPGGFSIQAGLKHERMEATRWLPFEDAYGTVFGHYDQAAFTLQLRYAPGEKFFQTRSFRRPINMDAPVFLLTHEYGPRGFLGSHFTLNKTEFSVQKRFWFSSFGYTDILLKAAKIWSTVQYPALTWANANLSYTIQPESFALMNPMEFATDSYASWDLTYWGNGILFNRIPIVNALRLREVITFRGLYGHLSSRNDPERNPGLFRFPFDTFTRRMTDMPYMEIGAGIDNILTILRVDYVWRLTYRDTPNADKSGVRVSLHFTF